MPRVQPITQAAAFNGSSSFFTIPITPSTSGFSIWFWAKSTTYTLNSRIVDWEDGGPVNGFTLEEAIPTANGQSIQCLILNNGSGKTIVNTPLQNTQFNHYCLTFDGSTGRFYVNNVLVSTVTSTTMTTATQVLTIGKRSSGASNFFSGRLAKLGFLNGRAITTAELAAIYVSDIQPNGTSAYYTFAGNVNDQTGSGNNGTATSLNYETYAARLSSVSSLSPKALNFFPSTTNVATVADTAVLRPEINNAFSWSAWIYAFKLNNNVLPRIVEKGQDYLCIMGDQTNGQCNHLCVTFQDTALNVPEYWGSTRLSPFTWYHVGAVVNSSGGQLYVNGYPEIMTLLSGPFNGTLASTSGANVAIGNSGSNNRNWPGLIRNLQQFNIDLTAAEMLQLSRGVNVSRGLVGQWNISEGSGSTVVDTSGNGSNAALTGGVWQTIVDARSSSSGRSQAGNRTVVV